MQNNSGPVTWAVFSALSERVARLETVGATAAAGASARRNRVWVVVIALMTGVVCPVIVTTIVTLLHLAGD